MKVGDKVKIKDFVGTFGGFEGKVTALNFFGTVKVDITSPMEKSEWKALYFGPEELEVVS